MEKIPFKEVRSMIVDHIDRFSTLLSFDRSMLTKINNTDNIFDVVEILTKHKYKKSEAWELIYCCIAKYN